MATVVSGAVLVADGFDMSCHFKSMEVSRSMDVLDATVLCTTGQRSYAAGLTENQLKAEGFYAYNSTTDSLSLDKQFADAMDASSHKIISIGEDGGSVGDRAVLMGTKQASYNVQETVGDLLMLNFEARATNGTTPAYGFAAGSNCVWLAYSAFTGTANGTSYDSTSGGTGYLAHAHCVVDDVTTATFKIQHSTDDSSWADLITFTAFTGVGAQQAGSTATSVNRYVRAICSAFTGTSATMAIAMKIGYSG